MNIDAECPLCGHKGRVPDKFSGKKVTCPQCCNVFNVNGANGTSGSHAGKERIGAGSQAGMMKSPAAGSQAGNVKSPTAGSKAGNGKSPTAGSKAGKDKVVKPAATHQGNQKVVKPAGSKQGAVKPVKAGSSATGTVKKPQASKAAFGGLEYDDATADEPVGRRKRKRKRSAVPMILSLFLLGGMVFGGIVVYDMAFGDNGDSTESVASNSETEKTDPDTRTTKDSPTETKPDELPLPPPNPVDVSKVPLKLGDIDIKITSVTIDKVKGEKIKAEDKHFIVNLEITNNSKRRVDYQGWGTEEPINVENPPAMFDSTGKAYKRLTFGPGAPVTGQIHAESIPAGMSLTDVMVFEAPSAEAAFVRVHLAAKNLSDSSLGSFKGKLKLELPQVMYAASLPKPPKKDPFPTKPPDEETRTVQYFRQLLKTSRQQKIRADCLTCLGEQGVKAYFALKEIIPLLKDRDVIIREEAAKALGYIGPVAAKEVIPAVQPLLKDRVPEVRAAAVKTLGMMGPLAKESLPAIQGLMKKDKDPKVQDAIKEAIKKIGPPPEMKKEEKKEEKKELKKIG